MSKQWVNFRIFVIHPGGLGDVLLALPALRALRAAHQGAALVLMASSSVGRLLEVCTEIQAFIPLEGNALGTLLAEGASIPDRLGNTVGMSDLAVCWMTDKDGKLARSLQSLGIRTIVIRPPLDGVDSIQHQSDRFLSSVCLLPGTPHDEKPLTLPAHILAEGKERVDKLVGGAERIVALHPGSGSRHKCTDPALFAELAHTLFKTGYQPVVVGGPADEENVRMVISQHSECIPHLTGLDLISMAGVIAQVRLFVGHDSGLTHLASVLGRPTLVIFGPTSIERWSPRGGHVRILTGESCHCDGWKSVQECRDKPCLRVAESHVFEACEMILTHDFELANPALHGGPSPCPAR